MRRLLVLLLVAGLVAGGPAPAVPAAEPEDLSAPAWLVYDETYGRRLAARDASSPRAMASTTKMMTALVVAERAGLDEPVLVSQRAADVGESEIDLVAGEVLPVRDLLAAVVIGSANDAAMALAEHVGDTVEGFVELMNAETRAMGLADTRFTNPHGLDEPGHHSSADDLLTIARELMSDELLAELAATRAYALPPHPQSGRPRVARTTNQLLRTYPGAVGVKTGFTSQAGLVLVAAANRDGRRVYAVVMGSEDHFADASALLEFAFTEFGPVEVLAPATAYVRWRMGAEVADLHAVETATVFLSSEQTDALSWRPVVGDDGRGDVVVTTVGEEVARSALTDPPPPPLPDVREAAAWASRYWEWLWGTG